jgi:hypothetical protein
MQDINFDKTLISKTDFEEKLSAFPDFECLRNVQPSASVGQLFTDHILELNGISSELSNTITQLVV